MIYRRTGISVLRAFLLCVLAIGSSRTANAQPDAEATSANADRWRSAYARCFDRRYNLLLPEMQQFVSNLEQESRQTYPRHTAADANSLLSYLASTYTQLGDWKKAEDANLRVVAAAVSTHKQVESAYWNLAGISAIHRQWGRALNYYVRRSGITFLFEVMPRILLCLSWLVFWRIGKSFPVRGNGGGQDKRRFPPDAFWRLVLFACIPAIFVLFWDIASPLNSYLFIRNTGTALVSYRTYQTVSTAVSIEWTVFSLLIALWIRKRKWITPEEQNAVQADSELVPAVKDMHPAKRWGLHFGRTLVIVGIGLWLTSASSRSYMYLLQNWNTYIGVIRRENVIDFLWVIDLLSISVLSPIAQEILFRGIIYTYARQVGDIGFGMAFSSFVFAAIHFQATDYQISVLVVVGVVLTCQYEFTRRLGPSIVTHCIANFLSVISHAGSPR